jgi:hypothetical protein
VTNESANEAGLSYAEKWGRDPYNKCIRNAINIKMVISITTILIISDLMDDMFSLLIKNFPYALA